MKFDVMDPTFLQAVLECGPKGVTILDMIAIIDYVDRSTPTLEMFKGALARLSISGLITEKDGKYFPTAYTDDIRITMKKTNIRRRQVRIISEFLDTWEVECLVRGKKCRMPTKKEYYDALDEYLGRK